MSMLGHVSGNHQGDAELIPSSSAARMLGVSQRTFNRWVLAGDIRPAWTVPGGTTRLFRRADIEAFRSDGDAA